MQRWNTNFDADELLGIFRTRHNYSTEQLAKVGAIICLVRYWSTSSSSRSGKWV